MIDAVRGILCPDGLLAHRLPGWESRPSQLAMAVRVAQALTWDERLLVEAGTGTGKTLAYLVPAIMSGRKVVVTTATRTLQDQIAGIDLPRLQSVLPRPFTFAVVKGLQNYLCLRRLDEQMRQASLLEDPADLVRLRAWAAETVTGDRAELRDLPDDSRAWTEVASSPETRIGARCPYYERCFVTAMRRRAAAAQIVVANHHLYFADLALRSSWPDAQVLPPYEAVIFDEAHQIEEIATEFFGLRVSTQRLLALARDVGRAAADDRHRAAVIGRRIAAAADALANALRARLPSPRPGTDEVRVPAPPDLFSGDTTSRYHELDTVLEETASWFARISDSRGDDEGGFPELAGLGRRAAAVRDELGAFVDSTRRDHVRWLSASPRNVSLRASPIDVGPTLGRALSDSAAAVVLTSATLSVAGSFEYVRARVGLADTAAEAAFPSPFRFGEQALLYVATDLPEPNEDSFAVATAERAGELCQITGGRALLLFTSFRNLRVAEAVLRKTLTMPMLVQGERPRAMLLSALRERIGSVLLATQSFWEGVDVPGEALSLVVMDRIPFAVPTDPLTAARIDRVRDEGGDPFGQYQVPRAAIALKQGFGRLIRTRSDHGIVAVLDGRLLRRSYSATLLASLPPECPRTESLADVAEFWKRVRRPGP